MSKHSRPARRLSLLVGIAAAFAVAVPALAQPIAAPPVYGPPIPGVCLFARDVALDRSLAGVSANQQIQQFTAGIRAELDAQRNSIVNDDRALAAQKASMPATEFQQRVAQLQQRYAAVERTRRTREAQVARTRAEAVRLILQTMTPSLGETITARKCSLVVEKAGTYGANPVMDVTDQVIQKMNARLQSVTLRLAPPDPADISN